MTIMPTRPLALALTACVCAAFRTPTVTRRDAIATLAVFAAPPAIAREAAPTTFDLLPESANVRPFVHYLENAGQLASHLEWYANGVDSTVGVGLDQEITLFAATYAPRPGSLVDAGPLPGLTELKAAYENLSYHFTRYKADTTTPLPDSLAGTVSRNAREAQKRIERVKALRAESAAS